VMGPRRDTHTNRWRRGIPGGFVMKAKVAKKSAAKAVRPVKAPPKKSPKVVTKKAAASAKGRESAPRAKTSPSLATASRVSTKATHSPVALEKRAATPIKPAGAPPRAPKKAPASVVARRKEMQHFRGLLLARQRELTQAYKISKDDS